MKKLISKKFGSDIFSKSRKEALVLFSKKRITRENQDNTSIFRSNSSIKILKF